MLSERISMVSLGHPHVQSLPTRLMTVCLGKHWKPHTKDAQRVTYFSLPLESERVPEVGGSRHTQE